MTDKTDIAALRERLIAIADVEELHSFAIYLLDQLEAERQRADDAVALNKHLDLAIRQGEGVNAKLRRSVEAAEKELDIRSHQLVKADASVTDLEKRLRCTEEALIAATDLHSTSLKGDQVPVAWQSVSTSSCNRMVTLHKEMAEDWERKGFAVTPLFTAPQKPVLPDELREDILRCVDDAMTGCNSLSAPDYAVRVAGWLATGGIVKDGE
jgi:hypothetical protein